MVRSTPRFRVEILVLALALITLPFAAGAKEESKIQIRLTDTNGQETGKETALAAAPSGPTSAPISRVPGSS
jgi:hypothetical protein